MSMAASSTVAHPPSLPSRDPNGSRNRHRPRLHGPSAATPAMTDSTAPSVQMDAGPSAASSGHIGSAAPSDGGGNTQGRGRGRGRGHGRGQGQAHSRGRGRGRGHTHRQRTQEAGTGGPGDAGGSRPAAAEATAEPLRQPPPRQHRRRQRFGGKLTADEGNSSSSARPGPSAATTSKDFSSLPLAQRISQELLYSQYDCSVCYSPITPRSSVSSCPSCYSVFHLGCLSEWASRSLATTSEHALLLRHRDRLEVPDTAILGHWRCPGCQAQHVGPSSVPKEYRCWCGRVSEPNKKKHNPSGHGNSGGAALLHGVQVPHSCGQTCAKSGREGGQGQSEGGCPHGCATECHPGPCPACTVVVNPRCHCGRTVRPMRCDQLHPQPSSERAASTAARKELLSCGAACGKLLACGRHRCASACHEGDCGVCPVQRDKRCYCGAVVKLSAPCDDKDAAQGSDVDAENAQGLVSGCVAPASPPSDSGSGWDGEFACTGRCPWRYACGVHSCDSGCHPHLSPSPSACPWDPQAVSTCPCGANTLAALSPSPRTKCTDPVPTCTATCRKPLPCGHECAARCHTGPCGPCGVPVMTPCRCGREKAWRLCSEVSALRAQGGEPAVEIRCERVCRAQRWCGKHPCGRRCCPLSFLEAVAPARGKRGAAASGSGRREAEGEAEDTEGLHVCPRVCGKTLSCGRHACERPDHRGGCQPCLRANFREASCHCGATVLEPPIRCGTVIRCDRPCQRPPPDCGHPKTPHTCHEEPDCPPCPFLTTRQCRCEKAHPVKNVRCSQEKVVCGQACGKLLACGAHRCRKACHLPGECEACDQTCAKPRKHCGHDCTLKCHAPTACSTEEPCTALVDAKCSCGHVTQRVPCSSCLARPQGNRDRTLKCNDACALAQRNAALAEALGIDEAQREAARPQREWDVGLLQYYGENLSFGKTTESQLEAFLRGDKTTMMFTSQPWARRKFQHGLVEAYGCVGESVDEEPNRSVRVTKRAMSASPKPLLSEAWLAQRRQPTNLTFGPPRKANSGAPPFNAVYLDNVLGHEESSLRALLAPRLAGAAFNLQWLGDEDVVLTLSTSTPSTSAAASSAWSGSSGTPESKLRTLRTSLRSLQATHPFCAAVELARVDPNTGKLERRESWTPVGPPEQTAHRWGNPDGGIPLSNAFGALAVGAGSKGSAAKTGGGAWRGGADPVTIGGGFNRPPAAVVAPASSPSSSLPRPKNAISRDVTPPPAEPEVDDWEALDA